jgi:hypothetical protein
METKKPRKKRRTKPVDPDKVMIDILVQALTDGL